MEKRGGSRVRARGARVRPRPRLIVFGLPSRLLQAARLLARWGVVAGLAVALVASFVGGWARGETLCGLPGESDPQGDGLRYGRVHEQDLPWFAAPPPRLAELLAAHGADRLLSAFRVSFPDPLFEETHNVAAAAGYLAGTVLPPGLTVSLNSVIGPFTAARGYRDGPSYVGGRLVASLGGGVCKVSTALYNAALLADVTVVERHPHSMPVPYVPPGRDAAIAWRVKDLRLRVDGDAPVVVWSAVDGDTVYVALYGRYDPPRVEWHQEELARTPFPTVRRANPELPPGHERVVIPGADGVTVRTAVTVTYPGQPPRRRELGTDAYRPLPQVVEYGPAR